MTHVGKQFLAPAQFADLDGDGGIDALLSVPANVRTGKLITR